MTRASAMIPRQTRRDNPKLLDFDIGVSHLRLGISSRVSRATVKRPPRSPNGEQPGAPLEKTSRARRQRKSADASARSASARKAPCG